MNIRENKKIKTKKDKMYIYIHIPFCKRKCLYCSFSVYVCREKHYESYLDCLEKEIYQYSDVKIDSLYVGGGTPSSLSLDNVERLFEIVRGKFKFKRNSEVTFEMNPEDANMKKLDLLKKMGVNRISLGVQSLNNKYLEYVGRGHTKKMARDAVLNVRKAGFDNCNVDLMYGYDGQTKQELVSDVEDICLLNIDHISMYCLTLEPGSKLHTKKTNQKTDDEMARNYVLVGQLAQERGFKQYEVSNFAKPRKQSRHNINYWESGDYIGLGMAAHSNLNGKRYWNEHRFVKYIKMIKDKGSALVGQEILTPGQRLIEAILFGLRMNKGVNIGSLEKRFSSRIGKSQEKVIVALIDDGLLKMKKSNLVVTQRGQLLLDEISVRLI